MSTWHPYPQVDQQAQRPDGELAILDFWERDGTFRAGAWIRQQTLARDLAIAAGPIAEGRRGELPDGRAVRIGLQAVRATPERESS